MNIFEYICIDGDNKFRSKTIFTEKSIEEVECIITDSLLIEKAIVSQGDIVLVPVKCIRNPLKRDDRHWLVFCEYRYPNDTNHKSNLRNKLNRLSEEYEDVRVAITQQFVLFKDEQPLGWDNKVDLIKNYSGKLEYSKSCQEVIDELTDAFLYCGIKISSFNMDRMVGKWAIGLSEQPLLEACDELFLVRYLINRICYNHNITPSYICNPYNRSQIFTRCYFAISTPEMRRENSLEEIVNACEKLKVKHLEQHKYLCKLNSRKFTYGQNNSQHDVNIVILDDNNGFIEDRRCAGDCNPYEVMNRIISAIVVEYNIQTMFHTLTEIQEKFNYRSSINFNSAKPVIYNKNRIPLFTAKDEKQEKIDEEQRRHEELKKQEELKTGRSKKERGKKEKEGRKISWIIRISKNFKNERRFQ